MKAKVTYKNLGPLYTLSIFTALGSASLGYCYSVYNPTLNHISRAMHWPKSQVAFREALGFAMIPGGALLVLCINLHRFSKVSRRTMLLLADIFMIIGAILTTIAVFWVFILGRLLLGIGCGLNGPMMPVYIRENAPATISGKMGSSIGIASSIGKCLGFILAFGLPVPPRGSNPYWRLMYAIPILLSLLRIGYLMIYHRYDTPKYYLLNEREDEAKKVLNNTFNEESVEEVVTDIKQQRRNEREISLKSIWTLYNSQVKISIMIAVLMQATGIHTLTAYSTAILTGSLVNDDLNPKQIREVNYVNLVMGIVRIVSAGYGGYMLDRIGRKTLLVVGCAIQAVSLIIMAIAIQLKYILLAESMVVTFSIGVAGGFGLVSFVYYSEVLPATGCSLMLIIDNMMNLLLNFSFPLMASIPGFGFAGALYVMAGFSLLGFFGLLKFVVETKGLSMYQIYQVFEKKNKKRDGLEDPTLEEEQQVLIDKND